MQFKRDDPPTIEELERNQAVQARIQAKVLELEAKEEAETVKRIDAASLGEEEDHAAKRMYSAQDPTSGMRGPLYTLIRSSLAITIINLLIDSPFFCLLNVNFLF